MNIVSKSFFTLSFLFLSSLLLGMEKLPLHYSKEDHEFTGFQMRILRLATYRSEGLVKCEKPLKFLGMVWAKNTFKRIITRDQDSYRFQYQYTDPFDENPFEICKKTKVLLGTFLLAQSQD